MEFTEGGCSRGNTQCASGLRLNAIQPARNHIGVAPCTVPPMSTNASNNQAMAFVAHFWCRELVKGLLLLLLWRPSSGALQN